MGGPAPTGASRLDLATPQRAVLSLPIAGVGSRALAYLVDACLLLGAWLVAFFAYSLAGSVLDLWGGLSQVARVGAVLGAFFVQWGYWTLAEVAWAGQTPGKRLLGIRVVRLDGSPVGLFESAVRNLLRLVDFLPLFYAAGLLAMLLDRQHRRLGDLAAGTVLVRLEKIDLSRYAAGTGASGATALSAQDVEVLTDFLARAEGLEPEARARLAAKLASRYLTHLGADERARLLAQPDALTAALRARVPAR